MRVSLFRFKNCLGIDELEVKPGKVTVISGGTGKGKTSVLETFVKKSTVSEKSESQEDNSKSIFD